MRKTTSGFTLIEVLVVVSIIGILTAVGFVSYDTIQSGARDSQRSARITILAEALEKYYDQNGEYPSCTDMIQTPETVASDTLEGIDPSILSVPDAPEGTNSIKSLCEDLLDTEDKFAYIGDGSDECKTGLSCLQYVLKYKEEATGNTISLVSRRTVNTVGVASAPLAPPEITVGLNGADVQATITPVECADGSTDQYKLNSHINNDRWVGWSDWATAADTTNATKLTAVEGTKYEYQAQARCFVSNFSYSNHITGDIESYVRQITTAPSSPTTTASTSNYLNTTYSWSTVACPTDTSPRYQYSFTTSYGFDFGWVITPSTSVNFVTSTFGYTYSVQAKAQCYNTYSTGPWGAAGNNAGYYRPVPTVQVLVVGGGGAGGASTSDDSGGGGGGGGVATHAGKTVYNQGYSVVVGGGGSGSGTNGSNSTFQDMTALGGGGGGMTNEGGNDGGCGGGGAGAQDGSTNSRGNALQDWPISGGGVPFGYDGGLGQWRSDGKAGGGGGGAGMIGGSAKDGGGNGKMNGGNGMQSSITGTNTYYAGGGGGGSCCYWGSGGAGGGGNGAENGHGSAGTNYTGGGGGGGDGSGGGNGGSGIVIIRYATGSLGAGGGSAYTSGSDTVHIFYGSGTFQVY